VSACINPVAQLHCFLGVLNTDTPSLPRYCRVVDFLPRPGHCLCFKRRLPLHLSPRVIVSNHSSVCTRRFAVWGSQVFCPLSCGLSQSQVARSFTSVDEIQQDAPPFQRSCGIFQREMFLPRSFGRPHQTSTGRGPDDGHHPCRCIVTSWMNHV
jgi:hypothetical protein